MMVTGHDHHTHFTKHRFPATWATGAFILRSVLKVCAVLTRALDVDEYAVGEQRRNGTASE
eukprot:5999564-Prymnesium_polylepis.1